MIHRLACGAIVAGLLFVGCGNEPATAPETTSGILPGDGSGEVRDEFGVAIRTGLKGQVVRGPICPVERVDDPCPDQPFRALFYVFDGADRQVVTFHSRDDGRFAVSLPAGNYFVVPDENAPLMQPKSQRMPVTVTAGAVTSVTLTFDTGIR